MEDRRVLQGRLTLVRYNNEPQFFVADAGVFLGLVGDVLERLGPAPRARQRGSRDDRPPARGPRARRAQDDAALSLRRSARPVPPPSAP